MTATARQVRLISAAAAALLSLGLVTTISQQLHVERLGAGLEVVQLEPVTITAPTTLAAAPVASATN